MTTTMLTRTDLTEYETEKIHLAEMRALEYSLEVSAFVIRDTRQRSAIKRAADLCDAMLTEFVNDTDIRTGALEYALKMSEFGMEDPHAFQGYRLRQEFLRDIYRLAIHIRNTRGLEA